VSMAEAANTLGNVVRDFRIIEALFRPGSVCHSRKLRPYSKELRGL
jgi:hypothetical protein